MSTNRITICTCDGHPVTQLGYLFWSLSQGGTLRVVAEGNTASAAVSMVKDHKPNVLITEVRFSQGEYPFIFNVLEDIRSASPDTKVLIVSEFNNPTYIARAIALGAKRYWLKTDIPYRLLREVKRVHKGLPDEHIPLGCESMMRHVSLIMRNNSKIETDEFSLTKRESQVLRILSLGLSNKEIGLVLGISIETVKEHIQNILRKTEWTDRTKAAVWYTQREMAAQ